MDRRIKEYRPIGSIAVWRFLRQKNYRGLNICFDQEGRNSLIQLIKLMLSSQWPSNKFLDLVTPLELAQNWITSVGQFNTYGRLVLMCHRKTTDHFHIVENDRSVELHFDDVKLNDFNQRLIDEAFDTGMMTSDRSDSINFW